MVVSFTPRPTALGERDPGSHWIGGWVSPRAGLDAVEKRTISCPCREFNPGHPAVSNRSTTELSRLLIKKHEDLVNSDGRKFGFILSTVRDVAKFRMYSGASWLTLQYRPATSEYSTRNNSRASTNFCLCRKS
jgi:hypothetical protein